MGRTYAGVLGLVAFIVMIARGTLEASGVDATIKAACISLFAFATIGYFIGRLADAAITESVRIDFRDRMRADASTTST